MAPRVLIFGTGSLGTVYAFILSRAIPSTNIVTVCRSSFEAASKNGFTLHSTLWGPSNKFHPIVVRTVTEAASLDPSTPFDYILVCSKAMPTVPPTCEIISPAVSPSTTIVLIQNGIAIEEPYAALFPQNVLLSTVAYVPATQTSPGIVSHKEIELMHIGQYPASPNTFAATKFAELIGKGGGSTEVHADVQFERWAKLLVNGSWNPVCALTRSRDAYFLRSNSEAETYIREVMLEIASVAQACGYSGIDEEMVEFQLKRATVREVPGVEPSMLADAMVGRGMEVEAIVGNVLRLAREKGVRTPLVWSIYMLAGALNDSFSRPV